jgi:hypothetical protein
MKTRQGSEQILFLPTRTVRSLSQYTPSSFKARVKTRRRAVYVSRRAGVRVITNEDELVRRLQDALGADRLVVHTGGESSYSKFIFIFIFIHFLDCLLVRIIRIISMALSCTQARLLYANNTKHETLSATSHRHPPPSPTTHYHSLPPRTHIPLTAAHHHHPVPTATHCHHTHTHICHSPPPATTTRHHSPLLRTTHLHHPLPPTTARPI